MNFFSVSLSPAVMLKAHPLPMQSRAVNMFGALFRPSGQDPDHVESFIPRVFNRMVSLFILSN